MAAQAMNVVEQMKAERDGLDVGADIQMFSDGGWESIPKADVDRLKWWGIFLRKQSEGEPGYFMMRIRIPNGIATARQVRCIAGIVREFGRDIADITTRQQIQLRWVRIENVPAILQRLQEVGLVTLQTGMDNIRNVVGCPLAGLTPNETLDASPVVREFTSLFVHNKSFTNLPRKFNVTITGCRENCSHTETQDLALVPATQTVRGHVVSGFNILVGGKMGSGGYTVASALDVFVEPREAAEVCAAVALIFRDHGPRAARSKARLAFLLEEWGVEGFRQVLEERLERTLPRAGTDERMEGCVDHLGVTPQKQPGLNAAGLVVPAGRITAAQLSGLARLACSYGKAELRFTVSQNVIVPHIHDNDLERFLAEPLLQELPANPGPVLRRMVSCTGTDFCNLALIDTKKRALALAKALDGKIDRPLAIHWSGCPAGCGNHGAADIGLVGKKIRAGSEIIEAVDIYVGGSSGPAATRAMLLMEDVPCDSLDTVLEMLARFGAFDAIRRRLAPAAPARPQVLPAEPERRMSIAS